MIDGRKVVAYTPAKGRSRGIPGKNLRPLLGRPVLAYTLDQARLCPCVDEVFVSTESPAVAEEAARRGAAVLPRPERLSGDDVGTDAVLMHDLELLAERIGEDGVILFLYCTSPIRDPAVLDEAVRAFARSGFQRSLVSVRRYPCSLHFALEREEGEAAPVRFAFGADKVTFRQLMPVHYYTDGYFMISTVGAVRARGTMHAEDDLTFDVTAHPHVDLDEPADLEMAEILIRGLRAAGRWPLKEGA